MPCSAATLYGVFVDWFAVNLLVSTPTRGMFVALLALAFCSIAKSAPPPVVPVPSVASAPAVPSPLFVLNSLDASISVIDPVTWKETQRMATGKEPHHLYMSPDEKSLIVANALGDSLTFIDPLSKIFHNFKKIPMSQLT